MWNRREFLLQTGLVLMLPTRLAPQAIQRATSETVADLGHDQLRALAAAMDEIIPAGEGMPSATEAGGLEYLKYLCWQYPGIQEEIAGFLDVVRRAAMPRFGIEFLDLHQEQRVQLLADLGRNRAPSFASFVGYVYEAYYTRPIVQGAISCPRSPAVADDLDTLLAPVRNMKRFYREVP